MNDYYLYILKYSDGTFYTGVTNNLDRRLIEHKTGIHKTSYTYHRRPVRLVYYQVFGDINDAIEREKQVQKWSQKKKRAIINNDWEELVRNSSTSKV